MSNFQGHIELILDEVQAALRGVPTGSADALCTALLGAQRVFAAGKGRSGLYTRAFAMRLMHLGLRVHVVDDVTTPAIGADDCLLIASGSGRTASLVGYASKASTLGARVALITAYPDSALGALADVIVPIGAPSIKAEVVGAAVSRQPMANLFEQTLCLLYDGLTLTLMAARGMSAEAMFERHANLE